MSVSIYQPAVSRAHSLADEGKIDWADSWAAPSDYEQADCIATHEGDTKDPGYPVIKGGKVCRAGVIAAKQRAAGEHAAAVESAADGILKAIDSHKSSQKASLTL